jgi:hypothetical protein
LVWAMGAIGLPPVDGDERGGSGPVCDMGHLYLSTTYLEHPGGRSHIGSRHAGPHIGRPSLAGCHSEPTSRTADRYGYRHAHGLTLAHAHPDGDAHCHRHTHTLAGAASPGLSGGHAPRVSEAE